MQTVRELLDHVPQVGRLEWIGVRSRRNGPVVAVDEVEVLAHHGLRGDHRVSDRDPDPRSIRHVTLLQSEHLPVVAALLGRATIDPALTRRNLLVAGINLRSLEGQRFRIGAAWFEGTGECHPCARMEATLGPGGYQAMRGHGGLTARVIAGGRIRVGDEVEACGPIARAAQVTEAEGAG